MRILVIEDEPRSARRLIRMIRSLRPHVHVFDPLAGIEAASHWFQHNPAPDLVFLDIELEDGTAFELLEQVDVAAPVIFCTAFSDYALQAFKANSIDYLLKPVPEKALSEALEKYDNLRELEIPPEAWRHLRGNRQAPFYRQKFLVRTKKSLEIVPVGDLIAITAWLKACRLILSSGKDWMFDEPLKDVGATLDPSAFFQISRQTIIRLSALSAIEKRPGGHVVLLHGQGEPFQLSRSRVAPLKAAIR